MITILFYTLCVKQDNSIERFTDVRAGLEQRGGIATPASYIFVYNPLNIGTVALGVKITYTWYNWDIKKYIKKKKPEQ